MSKFTKAGGVTPHDTNDQKLDTRFGTSLDAIFVGVGGDVNLTLSGNGESAVLFKNMISGTIYELSPKFIMSTSTTATDIVALDTGAKYD